MGGPALGLGESAWLPWLGLALGLVITAAVAWVLGAGAAMGLLPSRGELRLAGERVARPSVEAMVARGVALVPERRELFGEMSVEDNLLLGGFSRWRARKFDQKQCMAEVFEVFPRLAERRAQLAATLSGGERQMLAIGRALMARPRLLMLDEPSLGLAPLIVHEVFRVIAALRRRGVSVFLVEQNARAALQVADRGYVLEMGAIALEGPAAHLLHDRRIVETYLGIGARGSGPAPSACGAPPRGGAAGGPAKPHPRRPGAC
jgi:branched-chain amino acid transport system ATP-binding protein